MIICNLCCSLLKSHGLCLMLDGVAACKKNRKTKGRSNNTLNERLNAAVDIICKISQVAMWPKFTRTYLCELF